MRLSADATGTTVANGAVSASKGTATTPPPNPAPPAHRKRQHNAKGKD